MRALTEISKNTGAGTARILIPGMLLLALNPALADVRLPRLLSDGMVLQRDAKVNVRGWADPGENVRVEFRNRIYRASTGRDGKWTITLPALEAGGPDSMRIAGNNSIVLHDVYVGDVWIASGQSNMELPMARVRDLYANEIANSDNSMIRHFEVPDRYNFKHPEDDLTGGAWEPANPRTVHAFTAVGYFFARELYERYRVPIGLINASLGGSPVEAWMSEQALAEFPRHLAVAKEFRNDALIREITASDTKRNEDWYALLDARDQGLKGKTWADPAHDVSSWPAMILPSFWDEAGLGSVNGAAWFRREITLPAALAGKPARLDMGRIVDADMTYVNGTLVGNVTYQYPPRKYEVPAGLLKAGRNVIAVRVISNIGRAGFIRDKPYKLAIDGTEIDLRGEWRYRLGATMEPLQPQTFIRWKPLGLYNAMIAPLLDHRVKGVIWYQGESNTRAPEEYAETFSALIKDWRRQWKQGEFPFLYVQLANFMEAPEHPVESQYAELREAQLKTLRAPKTAMAVAIDLGEWNDIHPLNKKDVSTRLALAARKIAYGEKNIVHSGPIYRSMKIRKGKVILSFTHIGGGLIARDGGELKEFAICGRDGKFVWARARIEGDKVVVWNDSISDPVAVRYAWADNPQGANLYNKEGLPASPFRTDDF
jgi:sialate O-acetylesterase